MTIDKEETMTIDEAIETLESAFLDPWCAPKGKLGDSIKLGIEALKLVDNLRFDGSPYYPNELPGETKQ